MSLRYLLKEESNILNYTVVSHQNFITGQSVPFGVLVQNSKELVSKFDVSERKYRQIKDISPDLDRQTFLNFGKTFNENFDTGQPIVISDNEGNRIEIAVTDPKFLNYLHSTYLTGYNYSEPRKVSDGKSASDHLDPLFAASVIAHN